MATSKSANKGILIKLTPQLVALIESRLQQTWSPEELVDAELVGILSFKIIYSWIHRGFLTEKEIVLRRKGKKPGTQKSMDDSMLKEPLKNGLKKLETGKFLGIGN